MQHGDDRRRRTVCGERGGSFSSLSFVVRVVAVVALAATPTQPLQHPVRRERGRRYELLHGRQAGYDTARRRRVENSLRSAVLCGRVPRGGASQSQSADDDGGYYARLGVRPGASGDDIKRAYRKKSLSCHPDKGGDEETFKRLGEAYSVLSDPQKRRLYDRFGVAGVDPAAAAARESSRRRSSQYGPGSAADARAAQAMFEQMFGSFGGAFGDAFGSGSSSSSSNNPFASAFGGFSAPHAGESRRARAPRRFAITVSLDDCFAGRTISVSLGDETCQVRVEPGMGEGDVIRARLAGQTVYFELREAPHAVFKRSGADLLVDASIPLADALGGAPRVAVKRLDGSTLRVNLAPLGTVLRHGALRSLDGEGMPVKGAPGRRGRLFVRVFVVFPKSINLDPRERAALRALLGAPPRKISDDFDSRLRTLREADPHDWGRGPSSSSSSSRPQNTRPQQQHQQQQRPSRGSSSSFFSSSQQQQQQQSRPGQRRGPPDDFDDDDDDDDYAGGFGGFFR